MGCKASFMLIYIANFTSTYSLRWIANQYEHPDVAMISTPSHLEIELGTRGSEYQGFYQSIQLLGYI